VNFNDWFVISTKNLAQSERPQLRNELEFHVLEAITAHQQIGISRFEAEEKAMLDLGDPKIAARAFSYSHFTTMEARRLGLETVVLPKWAKWAGAMFLMAATYFFSCLQFGPQACTQP
jgi:hypothetical protein